MTPNELKEHPLFGSYAAVARACGVSREAARKWKQIPAEHCRDLELFAADRGHLDLTRYAMRPDVFGGAQGVNVDHDNGRPRHEVQAVEVERAKERNNKSG